MVAGAAEEFIEKFQYKLLVSGYNQSEREDIVKEGEARYRNILDKVALGERPLYRPADWKKKERAIGKIRDKKSWFGKTNDSVLFVQATPGEVLRKRLQAVVKDHGMKVKVVEKGGRSLKGSLQKSDIEPLEGCGQECVVCQTGGKNCHREFVGIE